MHNNYYNNYQNNYSIIFPNADELRLGQSSVDLVCFNEATAISLAVITARNSNLYQATVNNGTTITNTTLESWQVFNANLTNSTLNVPSHGFTTGQTVALSTTGVLPAPLFLGYSYYVIVIDANNFQLAISQANALGNEYITLFTIGTGIGSVQGYTTAQEYYLVWNFYMVNRTYSIQLNQILGHFRNIGYVIYLSTNPITNSTLVWNMQW